MRKVLILIVCCISAMFAYANDGAFYAEGNHLIPVTETDIRVQKEVLTLNRVDDRIEVTVYYELFNPVGVKEVLVGFEAEPPSVNFDKYSVKAFPEHPYIRNFKVTMNGDPLTFEVAHVSHYDENWKYISHPQYYVDGKIKSASIKELELERWFNDVEADEEADAHPLYVYHFNARFRPGLNIIQHTYEYDMSESYNGALYEFSYVLTAANRWANNGIDDFTLYINMGDHSSFNISPSFFKSAREWEIMGKGKDVIDASYMQRDSIRFHMQQGSIRFHKDQFHPDGNLHISQDRSRSHFYYKSRYHDFKYNAAGVIDDIKDCYLSSLEIMQKREDSYYDEFTPEQRRILKNLPFAYRGYIFGSKELQDFYESTAWYIPNPDYKADVQKLPEEEQKWVEFWSPSDQNALSKEVEKRVTDIYNHVFTEYVKLWDSHQVPSVDSFNSLYFSKEFLHLNQMIGDFEEQSGGPIVNDADHWICAQDWGKDLKANVLRVKMIDDKKANVDVNIHNFGTDHKQTLSLIYEQGNWFIDDMYVSSMRNSILEAIEDCKKDGLVPRIK